MIEIKTFLNAKAKLKLNAKENKALLSEEIKN